MPRFEEKGERLDTQAAINSNAPKKGALTAIKEFATQWTMAIGLLAVAVTATWTIQDSRNADLVREITALKDAKTWDVPQTISEIKAAAAELKTELANSRALKTLEATTASLEKEIVNLRSQVSAAEERSARLMEQNRKLQGELLAASMAGHPIELSVGESADLIPNVTVLSVTDTYGVGRVSGYLANKSFNIDVGQQLSVRAADRSCSVTLKRLVQKKATFTFLCAVQTTPKD